MKRHFSKKAFTLVELSIVLVIIGLIISSVLVGQDLVRQGEIRATVTQYEQFQAAVATFKAKYGNLPGDADLQGDFGIGATHTGDKKKNGVLEDSSNVSTTTTKHDEEMVYFWNQLGSSGTALISGSFDGATLVAADIDKTLPKAKVGGHWGVFQEAGVNYYLMSAKAVAGADYGNEAVLTPIDAASFDVKIDDGKPHRGIITVTKQSDTIPYTVVDDSTCAANTSGGASSGYETTVSTTTCILRIRIGL